MSLPQYTDVNLARRLGLARMAEIARIVKTRPQTVDMWIKRRRTSHFPMPVAVLKYGSKWVDLYDTATVIEWKLNYIPSTGGAPKGNRNWAGTKTSS